MKHTKRGRPSQNLVSVHYKVTQQTADTINELSEEMQIAKGKVVDKAINEFNNHFRDITKKIK